MKTVIVAIMLLICGVCVAEEMKSGQAKLEPKRTEDEFDHSDYYRGGYEAQQVNREEPINIDELMKTYTSSIPDYSSEKDR